MGVSIINHQESQLQIPADTVRFGAPVILTYWTLYQTKSQF